MTTVTVAIQGEAGSFSHAAALQALGPAIRLVPCPSFEDLFRAVERGDAARGTVPIENSLAGSVHENYDLLGAHALHVVGETQVRVRHCLIARPGTERAAIRRVASHPVALAQCRRFFTEHPEVMPVPAYDTAGHSTYLVANGRELTDVTGYRTFRQVAWAGTFEGYTTLGLGVRARLPFRVLQLPGPGTGSRVVIDVAHTW